MDLRSAKIFLASTATVAVVSQVVKKVYKYLFNKRKPVKTEAGFADLINDDGKLREVNDVLVFSDDNTCNSEPLANTKTKQNLKSKISNVRETNCLKLIQYLHAAQETLDVCMYLITSTEIAEHIVRLGQNHVLVRILVDHDTAFTPPSQIKKLMEYSFIQVQTSKETILMHHKFCIIDGPKAVKRKYALKAHAEKLNVHIQMSNKKNLKKSVKNRPVKGFVMSGSLNWSTQAMVSNQESVIVTSNPNIVTKFEKVFESLWEENEPVLRQSS